MRNLESVFPLSLPLSVIGRGRPRHGGLAIFATLLFLAFSGSAVDLAAESPRVAVATPESVGIDGSQFDQIQGAVEESIEANKIPGCVVLITHRGKTVYHRAFGHRQLEPSKLPMEKDTVFDMASLTKPVATGTSVMLLAEQGKLGIDDRYGKHIEVFNQSGKEAVTVFQMLTHQAGFVPDSPLREYADSEQIWPNLWKLGLRYEPTTKFVYSDVGFQMLGKLVEHRSGQTLAEFSKANVFSPLGMTETGFLPPDELRQRAATTEQREGRWMKGEVHDPRSYAMGGVAGHAGLFSTASDLAIYANMILGKGQYNGVRIMKPETVAKMAAPHVVTERDTRALGWDVKSRYSSNRGSSMSAQAIGHGGFTGTAMWIDPSLDLAVIFLSNRVHPNGKGSANKLAGRIGTIAADAVRTARGEPNVFTGIDVLLRDSFSVLKDQRIGLITNHTGVSRDGKRNIDLLAAAADVELKLIFSPEHGIKGIRDEKIGDATDETTGMPIYSLYGANRTPADEAIEQIDTLVFDIQDIGTRFYTYISTMLNSMQAAAKSNKRFVVLDRPNPLGGMVVAGPVLDDGKQSFVGCHTIAVQHGMTVGELAQMFKSELKLELDLEVIRTENWSRNMLWDETGLTWINPSPNMRTWNQALLYPGVGLLETTNLSVGRGTDRPFEIVAAPYIQPRNFAAALNQAKLPGLRFIPRYITPNASKFKDEQCGAVDIVITNREAVQAVKAGITLATTLRKLYPKQWSLQHFDRLLCDDSVRAQVTDGKNPSSIVESYQRELDKFKQRRNGHLIYR